MSFVLPDEMAYKYGAESCFETPLTMSSLSSFDVIAKKIIVTLGVEIDVLILERKFEVTLFGFEIVRPLFSCAVSWLFLPHLMLNVLSHEHTHKRQFFSKSVSQLVR